MKLLLTILLLVAAGAAQQPDRTTRIGLVDCDGQRVFGTPHAYKLQDSFEHTVWKYEWVLRAPQYTHEHPLRICSTTLQRATGFGKEEFGKHVYKLESIPGMADRDSITVTWNVTRWWKLVPDPKHPHKQIAQLQIAVAAR